MREEQAASGRVGGLLTQVRLSTVHSDTAVAQYLGEVTHENESRIRHIATYTKSLTIRGHTTYQITRVIIRYAMHKSAVIGNVGTTDMVLKFYLGYFGRGV